jgi:hypothetical protein
MPDSIQLGEYSMGSGIEGTSYNSDGDPNVLNANRNDDGQWLNANWDHPDNHWNDNGAFAFLVPYKMPIFFVVSYRGCEGEDAEQVLRRIAKRLPLRLERLSARAKLRLPYPDNMRDVVTVAEFLLNKHWEEIPADIRDSVLAYVRDKHGQLQQIDGFLIVKRVNRQKKR